MSALKQVAKELKLPIAVSFVALFGAVLSGCTTTEGGNALVSAETFEKEVVRSTLQSVGVIGGEDVKITNYDRPDLVIPSGSTQIPAPTETVEEQGSQPAERNLVKSILGDQSGAPVTQVGAGEAQEGPISPTELREGGKKYRAAVAARKQASGESLATPPSHLIQLAEPVETVTTLTKEAPKKPKTCGDLLKQGYTVKKILAEYPQCAKKS